MTMRRCAVKTVPSKNKTSCSQHSFELHQWLAAFIIISRFPGALLNQMKWEKWRESFKLGDFNKCHAVRKRTELAHKPDTESGNIFNFFIWTIHQMSELQPYSLFVQSLTDKSSHDNKNVMWSHFCPLKQLFIFLLQYKDWTDARKLVTRSRYTDIICALSSIKRHCNTKRDLSQWPETSCLFFCCKTRIELMLENLWLDHARQILSVPFHQW